MTLSWGIFKGFMKPVSSTALRMKSLDQVIVIGTGNVCWIIIVFGRIYSRIACIGKTFNATCLLIAKLRNFTVSKELALRIDHEIIFGNLLHTYKVKYISLKGLGNTVKGIVINRRIP